MTQRELMFQSDRFTTMMHNQKLTVLAKLDHEQQKFLVSQLIFSLEDEHLVDAYEKIGNYLKLMNKFPKENK